MAEFHFLITFTQLKPTNFPTLVCARCSIDLSIAVKLKKVALSSYIKTSRVLQGFPTATNTNASQVMKPIELRPATLRIPNVSIVKCEVKTPASKCFSVMQPRISLNNKSSASLDSINVDSRDFSFNSTNNEVTRRSYPGTVTGRKFTKGVTLSRVCPPKSQGFVTSTPKPEFVVKQPTMKVQQAIQKVLNSNIAIKQSINKQSIQKPKTSMIAKHVEQQIQQRNTVASSAPSNFTKKIIIVRKTSPPLAAGNQKEAGKRVNEVESECEIAAKKSRDGN